MSVSPFAPHFFMQVGLWSLLLATTTQSAVIENASTLIKSSAEATLTVSQANLSAQASQVAIERNGSSHVGNASPTLAVIQENLSAQATQAAVALTDSSHVGNETATPAVSQAIPSAQAPPPTLPPVPAIQGSDQKAKLEEELRASKTKLDNQISAAVVEKASLEKQVSDAATERAALEKQKSELAARVQELEAKIAKMTLAFQASENVIKQSRIQGAQDKSELLAAASSETDKLLKQIAKTDKVEKAEAAAHQKASECLDTSASQRAAWHREKTDLQASWNKTEAALWAKLEQKFRDAEALNAQLALQIKKKSNLAENYTQLQARYADPSLQHFLTAKATKVYAHPGIEGAANKTYAYYAWVLPSILPYEQGGMKWLNETHLSVHSQLKNNSLVAYLGEEYAGPWLPFLSGSLVYGMVFCPLVATIWCLTRVVCRLRPCLLFFHLYLAISAACASGFAALTGTDPLRYFATHDTAVYLFAQASVGGVFCFYMLFLLLACSCSKRGTGESTYRFLQLIGASGVGAAYYILVWTPAMVDQLPRVDELFGGSLLWLPYLLPCILFSALLRFEQLSWRAAGAAEEREKRINSNFEGRRTGKRENATMSIAIREDGSVRGEELASLIGGTDVEAAGKRDC